LFFKIRNDKVEQQRDKSKSEVHCVASKNYVAKKVIVKIKNAECAAGNSDNGIMALLQYLIFGVKNNFIVERDEKYGGNLVYESYEKVESDFKSKKLHPLDLKNAVAKEINILLENFRKDKKLKELHKIAYP